MESTNKTTVEISAPAKPVATWFKATAPDGSYVEGQLNNPNAVNAAAALAGVPTAAARKCFAGDKGRLGGYTGIIYFEPDAAE